MSISIPGRVVVFDYGEVISTAPEQHDRDELLRLAGAVPAAFWPAYGRHRDALDRGTLSIRDYWRGIATELGSEWDDVLIDRLWAADFRSWLSVDTGTLAVLHDLADGGTRLALLSNAGPDFGSFFRFGNLGRLFDAVIVSGELGMIKPEAGIFEHAMAELGIEAAQTIFIDNKEVNVRGAEQLGITGHTFTGAAQLRAFLTDLAR
ncbi:HAD family phosphatase [Microbacterium sp. STN6]|uniref:HAD family hydrolase n=1 Tax=Microbacterium sp. STN6 TaxID=2995588 RepID=UPI002260966F|nr:HAD family phosphatase [Microbacterium sp. STN6]MCX7521115.1 HAD family phosphatase [Microbacterium sp. STN6]